MASHDIVQTRIDADVKEKATRGSGEHGSDGWPTPLRIPLTRTANESMLPFELVSNSLLQLVS